MTYAPLDDRFDDCVKYSERTAAEMGLIACAITYANRNLSDGRIPKVWPERRFGREGARIASKLVTLGVWFVRADGDFEIEGFLDHNPSRERVLEKKAKKSMAGASGGLASGASRRSKNEADASGLLQANAKHAGQPRLTTDSLQTQTQTQKEDPPTPLPDELVERDRPWSIEKYEAESQRKFWSTAYADAVNESRPGPVWKFIEADFWTLKSVIEARCTGDDRKNIDGWIRREVTKFVRGVLAIDEDQAFWSGFAPKGFARWLNDPRSTPKPKVKNTYTDFTYAGRAAAAVNAQDRNRGTQETPGGLDGQKTTARSSEVVRARPGPIAADQVAPESAVRLPEVG